MNTYWPWWAGAIGLAVLTIGYALATDRSFGISGAWDRVLHWRRESELEREEAKFADERALAVALEAATAEHFATAPAVTSGAVTVGSATPGAVKSGADQVGSVTLGAAAADDEPVAVRPRPAPLVTQVALLVSVFVGALIASVTSGRFHLRFDMGPGFRELVTGNPVGMVVTLFVGGVLVGFGTRLSGGCTSGHGLNGCGRRDPASIVATATFFGTAVAVSFLLWKVF